MSFDVHGYLKEFRQKARRRGFRCAPLVEVNGYEVAAYTKLASEKPRVYLSSGMHGDEPAGVMAMLRLLEDGCFDERIEWRISPVINPTGLAVGTRENHLGVDLNRDYLLRKTDEVSAHVDWLEKQPVPEMFISLHEDWESSGFYLYEIQKRGCPSTAPAILDAAAAQISIEPNSVIDDHTVREPGWIFHEPNADFPGQWPEAIFMAEIGTRVSYTLETPSSLPLEKRVECHILAVKTAVEEFLLTRSEAEGCNSEV